MDHQQPLGAHPAMVYAVRAVQPVGDGPLYGRPAVRRRRWSPTLPAAPLRVVHAGRTECHGQVGRAVRQTTRLGGSRHTDTGSVTIRPLTFTPMGARTAADPLSSPVWRLCGAHPPHVEHVSMPYRYTIISHLGWVWARLLRVEMQSGWLLSNHLRSDAYLYSSPSN